jgi:hypothetical protein
MKVANVTVMAMIHGLISGRQSSALALAFSNGGAAALIAGSKPWV